MLEHRVLTDLRPRARAPRVRVSWPLTAHAARPPRRLNLRRGGERLATAARLGLAGAALLAAPGLRLRSTPRWWPSFLSAAKAAGPRAVAWTIVWSACRAAMWVAAGFRD